MAAPWYWEFYHKDKDKMGRPTPGVATCKRCVCEVKFSNGQSGLRTHLERIHDIKQLEPDAKRQKTLSAGMKVLN